MLLSSYPQIIITVKLLQRVVYIFFQFFLN